MLEILVNHLSFLFSFFRRQISLDCKFLESQSIIDYSMLLGLHFRAPEHLKAYSKSQNLLKHSANSADDNGRYLLQFWYLTKLNT